MSMPPNYNSGYERPGAGIPGDWGSAGVGAPAPAPAPGAPTIVGTTTNPDGSTTTTYSDGTVKTSGGSGGAGATGPNGAVTGVVTNPDGSTTTTYANGMSITEGGSGGAAGAPGLSNPTGTDPVLTGQNGMSIDFNSALQIINSALSIVGLDPTQVSTSGSNVGQTLGNYFWSLITTQGITDPTTIGDMITTVLPSTGQFNTAFPGYQEALKNGYVRTVGEYVSAEEGITAVMLQGGVPKDLINPTSVGNLISNGVSVNEVATRVNNGLDAALNAPAEVQNYFAQEFGAGTGPNALAQVFLNPQVDDVTLQKMLAGAQIRGAAAASNLTISQGLSQRLADQGQTYASAQSQFKNLTAQAGLFQQTVGEQSSQAPVAGTQNQNQPLTESNQGVAAAFGTSANADQQVHQAALARANEFRGGGAAANTVSEGFSGLANAKAF